MTCNLKTPSNALLLLLISLGTCFLASAATPPRFHDPYYRRRYETAQQVITALNLTANPEKGYYTQTYVDPLNVTFVATTINGTAYTTTRSASTLIYYLLTGDEGDSYWHRHDAAEVWHHYAGAPLRLDLSWDDGEPVTSIIMGADVVTGATSQAVVTAWEWQRARSLGDWTLVGTTGRFLFVITRPPPPLRLFL